MTHIILDLDGCIADDRRRLPLIDLSKPDPWLAYHFDCGNDALINRRLVHIARKTKTFIFTARPETYRPQTERWLTQVARLKVARLFMRPNKPRQFWDLSSPELKEHHLNQLIASGIDLRHISLAVDDREDVLDMYQRRDIPIRRAVYPKGKWRID